MRNGDFLAVLAETEHEAEAEAEAAAARLGACLGARLAWEERDTLPDEAAMAEWLHATSQKETVIIERGEAPPARGVAARFFRPPVAHASIGPSCAIARWEQGRLEVTSNGHSSRPGRGKLPTLLAAAHLAEPFAVPPAINVSAERGGGAQRNAVPIERVPALRVRMRTVTEMPLRASAMRGLGAPLNVWAIESVMDELAALAGADPLHFRLRHLDDPRAAAVLREAAAMAGWEGRTRRGGLGWAWRWRATRTWAGGARSSPRWRRKRSCAPGGSGSPPTWGR